MIDFCHSELDTKVNGDTAFEDNFGPENLLVNDLTLKKKGCQAASFVRPPISITFEFKNSLKISHIEFNCHKNSIIEISGSGEDRNLEVLSRVRPQKSDQNITIKNYFFPGNSVLPSQRLDTEFRLSSPRQNRTLLKDIKFLQITVQRTRNSSAVRLSDLKIFGTSCKSDAARWQKIHRNSVEKRNDTFLKFFNSENPQVEVPKPKTETQASFDAVEDIPNEFLDGLTFELMHVPMVLPSGQIVDKKTIDTHDQNERSHGRLPNDPFTGKPYTDNLRPRLDTVLKSRIDSFCIKRSGSLVPLKKRSELVEEKKPASPSVKKLKRDTEPTTSSCVLSNLLKDRTPLLVTKVEEVCSGCRAKDLVYRLASCSHFLCRNCALKLHTSNNNCNRCGKSFARSEVIKYHDQKQDA